MIESFRYSNWLLLGLSALLSAAAWIRYHRRHDGISAGGWFPGCVFGLALGVIHLNSYEFLLAVAVASGCAFVLAITLAVHIKVFEKLELFARLSVVQRARNWGINAAAGAVAGAVGALTVSVALKCAAGIRLHPRTEAVGVAVGALCGVLFMQEQPSSFPHWLKTILAFLIWQIPVGLVLGSSINQVPQAERSLVFADHFRAFLAGPTIQLIALIGSLASVASLLLKDRGGVKQSAQQDDVPRN